MMERLRRATANDLFKRRNADWTRAGLIVGVAVHLTAFSLIQFEVQELVAAEENALVLVIPPDARLPDAPQEITRPALPRISHLPALEDAPVARWEYIPSAPVAPPVAVERASRARFVPYDTPPKLENLDEVGRALQREYPRALRRSNVEGRVELWLYVTEEGSVRSSEIKTSSGNAQLDEAALRVAAEMRFSPALNRDRKTAVWVQQWISFVIR